MARASRPARFGRPPRGRAIAADGAPAGPRRPRIPIREVLAASLVKGTSRSAEATAKGVGMRGWRLCVGSAALLAACGAEPAPRRATPPATAPARAAAPAIERAPTLAEQLRECKATPPDAAALAAHVGAGRYAEIESAFAALEVAYAADPNCEQHLWATFEALQAVDGGALDRWAAARPSSWMPFVARAGHSLDTFQLERYRARNLGQEEAQAIAEAIGRAHVDLQRALELSPDGLVPVGYGAWFQYYTGDQERIFELLGRLAARDPLAQGARDRAARALATRYGGNVDALRRIADGAAPYVDRNPRLRLFAGHVEAELGVGAWHHRDYRAAAEHYRRALAYSAQPNWADDLGNVLDQLDAWPELETSGARWIELWPDNAVGYLWRGRARMAQRRPAEALPDLEVAAGKLPRHRYAHSLRGQALEQLGRLEDAAAAYEVVLGISPSHSWARERLAKVRERLAATSDASRTLPGLALIGGKGE